MSPKMGQRNDYCNWIDDFHLPMLPEASSVVLNQKNWVSLLSSHSGIVRLPPGPPRGQEAQGRLVWGWQKIDQLGSSVLLYRDLWVIIYRYLAYKFSEVFGIGVLRSGVVFYKCLRYSNAEVWSIQVNSAQDIVTKLHSDVLYWQGIDISV